MKLMSKILGVLLVSVFLWGTLGLDYVQARGSVGAIVVHVKGKVKVKRDGTRRFKKLKVNDLLFTGDQVRTWKRATASIILKGGAEVRLNQKSKFEISKKGKLRQIIELGFGQLWTRMLHKMAKINVKTPTAVCAIRGT
ncbi:MAG: FecR domain-containing protein, partial [Elusimicrobiales bacterium]|nr:FecR domain-containing protein [Elusimicrobiales bacterium]